MEMKTERLIVRSFKFDDYLDLFEMCCDEPTARLAGWRPHNSLDDTKSVVATHIYEDDTFAIVLKESNKVIGTISLYDNNNPEVKSKDLGFCLNKNYRKQGYMKEACDLMVKMAFRAYRVDVLTTCHADFNTNCKKVIEKLPFVAQGLKKDYRMLYDGTKCNCFTYSIKKEDY